MQQDFMKVVAFITFCLEGIIVTIYAQQIPFNLLSVHVYTPQVPSSPNQTTET